MFSWTIVALLAFAAAGTVPAAARPDPNVASHDAGPCRDAVRRAVLATEAEPGTRLVVTGRVFLADGTTPAAGVIVYAYQTDATGVYARWLAPPRLRGWARTDGDGGYELVTIRPAPYPGSRVPAHVHFQVWGTGLPPEWAADLQFDDDPFLGDADRARSAAAGRFGSVRRPAVEGTTLRVVHDLRVGSGLTTFERHTRHGIEACSAD